MQDEGKSYKSSSVGVPLSELKSPSKKKRSVITGIQDEGKSDNSSSVGVPLSELKSSSKKKRRSAFLLTADEESNLVEWVWSNELLYDKSKRE